MTTDTTNEAAPTGESGAINLEGGASAERVDWLRLIAESFRQAFRPTVWLKTIRHPGDALRRTIGSGPIYPLVVLFGLNAVDELDRTGFGILVPNIRDDLGLSNQGILSLIGLTLA